MEHTTKAAGYKVLVVEDNLINREIARDFLSTYKFGIWEAENGFQAVKLVKEIKFDMIFMDYLMPEMDGIKTAEKIRNECGENGKNPVIIGLTASETEGCREKFLQNGFQDFLLKPLMAEGLNQVLFRWAPREVLEKIPADSFQGKGNAAGGFETHIEGIDSEAVGKYHGDSLEDYKELLKLYVMDGKRKRMRLTELYEDKDYTRYEVEVHGLKSASANIGAMELSRKFKEQENAAGRGDKEYIAREFPELISSYEKQLENIENYLKSQEVSERDLSLPKLDKSQVVLKLQAALEQLLKFRSRDCLKEIQELMQCNVQEDLRERLTEIEEQLRLYEDSEAEQLLCRLLDWIVEEEL